MYEKPMFFETDDLAEGIYLSSGAGDTCWQYQGWRPDDNFFVEGVDEYRFRVDFKHIEVNHYNSKDAFVTLFFNHPVTVVSCDHVSGGTSGISGNGTTTISFTTDMGLGNNQNENFSIGMRVKTQNNVKPAVTGGTIVDKG